MTTRTQIIEALKAARRWHYSCEDAWYSCPKSEGGCANEYAGTECSCGADKTNASIDAAIAELEKQEAVQAEPRHMTPEEKTAMSAALKRSVTFVGEHPSPKPADERIIPATCGGREHCSRFPFCPCSAPDPLPERDPAKPAEKQGLFNKFSVRRTDGSDQIGGKHQGCEYFVLDVKCDRFAKAALTAYADACKHDYLELSVNMRDRYDLSPPKEAKASGLNPADPDLLALVDEIEGVFLGLLRCKADCGFSRQDDACDCGMRTKRNRVRTLTAKLRSLLGGEV